MIIYFEFVDKMETCDHGFFVTHLKDHFNWIRPRDLKGILSLALGELNTRLASDIFYLKSSTNK